MVATVTGTWNGARLQIVQFMCLCIIILGNSKSKRLVYNFKKQIQLGILLFI